MSLVEYGTIEQQTPTGKWIDLIAPAAALALDDGARLVVAEGGWRAGPGVFRLTPAGRVEPAGELP